MNGLYKSLTWVGMTVVAGAVVNTTTFCEALTTGTPVVHRPTGPTGEEAVAGLTIREPPSVWFASARICDQGGVVR